MPSIRNRNCPGPSREVAIGFGFALAGASASTAQYAEYYTQDTVGVVESILTLHDIDGDSVEDVLLASRTFVNPDGSLGAILAASGADGQILYSYSGPGADHDVQEFAGLIGDVDGDGHDDIVALGLGPGGNSQFSTQAWVYAVSSQTGIQLWATEVDDTLWSSEPQVVDCLDDLNGDGLRDFIVSLRWSTSTSTGWRAYACSAHDGSAIYWTSTGSDDGFAEHLARIGDVNGDLIRDFAASNVHSVPGFPAIRSVSVHSGWSGAVIYEVPTSYFASFWGEGISDLQVDLDGDGISEWAALADEGFSAPGDDTVIICSGATGAVIRSHAIYKPVAIDPLSDLDGDLVGDYCVLSAPPAGALLTIFEGNLGTSLFFAQLKDYTNAIATVGDLNGDGSQDLFTSSAYTGYVSYLLGCVPWSMTTCPGLPNSTGVVGQLTANACGSSSSNGYLELRATSIPPNQFGYFLMSQTASSSPVGSGVLCLGAPIVRLNVLPGSTLYSGQDAVAVRLVDLETLPQGAIAAPGSSWYFQFWHRDFEPGVGWNSNFTSGLQVVF